MTQRGQELSATADAQVAELIDLVSSLGRAALHRPCGGREKLARRAHLPDARRW
jgi:hypothetical protein